MERKLDLTQAPLADTYMLGRTEAETKRLIAQSQLYGPFTRRLFEEARLAPGMTVLDVGSGAGDVSLMVAETVGPKGRVVGIDQNPTVLRIARARARAAGFANATFLEGDIGAVIPEEDFDAVVGRLVLLYVSDPAEVLRKLVRKVRPGGILAFQDFDLTPRSFVAHPSMPLWERFFGWVASVAESTLANPQMGYKLFHTYLAAGLPAPKMEVNSPVGGGPNWAGYELAAETLRSMMPLVLRFGIATAEEVEIETLAERLREETMRYCGVAKVPDMVSAWALKP